MVSEKPSPTSCYKPLTVLPGSRGPAVLDDFTASYGYKFSDAAGYQWPLHDGTAGPNKL
jgi:glucose-6-phosphate 1-dehydrogenase